MAASAHTAQDRGTRWMNEEDIARAVSDDPTQKAELIHSRNYVWNSSTLAWDRMTQPTASAGGGPATIADGADATQGAIADVAVTGDNSGTLSAKLRGFNKVITNVWDSVNGRLKVDGSGVTQPVSQIGTWTVQPGNTANTTAWKVDGSAVTQPVSGTITANQGGAPWSQNLTQVAGSALALKALPTNADGQAALPVWVNAQQYATYDAAARNVSTGALTANTVKPVLSIEHSGAAIKTVRLRRIMVHFLQTTALAGPVDIQITRGTAASSAGSAITPQTRKLGDAGAEAVVKSLPTIVAATVADNIPAGGFGSTTALYSPPVLVYDWQEDGEEKAYILRPAQLESIVLNVISTVAHNLTMTISVDFTEE